MLMVTFLLGWRLDERSFAGRAELVDPRRRDPWRSSPSFRRRSTSTCCSPFTIFLKSPVLGTVPNLDFDKEQVGLETVKDLGSKIVLDAFTCVECGRCQVNCPAWAAGKTLNPKTLILQTQDALLAGERDRKLGEIYSESVLWQCTTCGACENQCPVGIEHLPLIIGSRRGLVSNGDAPAYLGGVYNNLERRGNIWGLGYDQRQKFVESAALDIFDPAKHDVLVWLGCAGAFEADFQKSLRSLFEILRARHVKFGVLSKERCTGDPAKRTGNEYMFQELANGNIADLKAAGPKTILTSCPHCVKTIGDDYRKFGYDVDVVHASVFVEALTRDVPRAAGHDSVTFHDPCYLGRYGGTVDEPRALLTRFGGEIAEPVRNRDNPYCCGAGGGLLFADKEEEPGTRISDVRFKQLTATGAGTVVTACPFCSIMLKGAQTSAPGAPEMQFVDLMTFVKERRELARLEAEAIRSGGHRHDRISPGRDARRDAPLADRRARAPRRDCRARTSANHGVLARPHSSGGLLLPPPRHRRHHEREFRRRVDCRHHRAVRVRHRARIDVARRAESAAAALTRHGGGAVGGVHDRRSARAGADRAARRGVVGTGHREPGAAVSP